MQVQSASSIIAKLNLCPHPEGGFFAETFRSKVQLTLSDGRIRSAGTAIYFLLPSGSFSTLHRVLSDEAWHYYDGDPVELTNITPQGILDRAILGSNLASGQNPHYVLPAGVWQGARPLASTGEGYTLVGCTVVAGFDFEDFEIPGRSKMEKIFPQHIAAIQELTRPD